MKTRYNKRFKEIFEGAGIFTTLQDFDHILYGELLDVAQPENLDFTAILSHGDRFVITKMTKENATDILNSIFVNRRESWKQQKHLLDIEFNPAELTNSQITEFFENVESLNTVIDQTNNKAFNSSDFVEVDKNTRQSENDNQRDQTSTKGETMQQADATRKIKESLLFRRDYTIYSVILYDVMNLITLKIY